MGKMKEAGTCPDCYAVSQSYFDNKVCPKCEAVEIARDYERAERALESSGGVVYSTDAF